MTQIRTDATNTFAHYTITTRLPAIIDAVIADNPSLPPEASAALRSLQSGLRANAPLRMFNRAAPDRERWERHFVSHAERIGGSATWHNSEWFFAEHFFYRHIIDAVDFWNTRLDPFAAAKDRELGSAELLGRFEALLGEDGSERERFEARLAESLWGNRIDLSHGPSRTHARVRRTHSRAGSVDLIIDHTADLWPLAAELTNSVHFVCDNAGAELAADLVLADWFMSRRRVRVCFHVKAHPTFVGDATASDANDLLNRLAAFPARSAVGRLAERLSRAHSTDMLRIVPDLFWNGPEYFNALPESLSRTFSRAGLIVIKGDMNYRRLLRDRIVPPTDPIERWADTLPATMVLLRTMKSDPVAGLDAERLSELEAAFPDWRTAGRHGLIELVHTQPD